MKSKKLRIAFGVAAILAVLIFFAVSGFQEGKAYAARVEMARGDMGTYIVADGKDKPYRVRFRTGSFTAMTVFEEISDGLMIADIVALISSLDVVAPEIDR